MVVVGSPGAAGGGGGNTPGGGGGGVGGKIGGGGGGMVTFCGGVPCMQLHSELHLLRNQPHAACA